MCSHFLLQISKLYFLNTCQAALAVPEKNQPTQRCYFLGFTSCMDPLPVWLGLWGTQCVNV